MSRLQYGCFLYANATKKHQHQLQKIQNKALRICYLATRYTSNISLHRSAEVWPLYLRGKLDLAKLMYRISRRQAKNAEGLINPGECSMVSTRSQGIPLEMAIPKTEKFVRSVCIHTGGLLLKCFKSLIYKTNK